MLQVMKCLTTPESHIGKFIIEGSATKMAVSNMNATASKASHSFCLGRCKARQSNRWGADESMLGQSGLIDWAHILWRGLTA